MRRNDPIWRSVLRDIGHWVIIPFSFVVLSIGAIWLLLSLHLILLAQILLVILIIAGFFLWLMVY
jgi:hypothetical protein